MRDRDIHTESTKEKVLSDFFTTLFISDIPSVLIVNSFWISQGSLADKRIHFS